MTAPAIAPVAEGRTRPLWSVMIPTCEPDLDLLRQTVDSVLASGLPAAEREIVLVDDATRAPAWGGFAEEMRARGIEVVRSDQRLGLPGNWNRCLARARGQWVHLLHQDDRVRPGFYAALARGLTAEPSAGAAFTQVAFVDAQGRERRRGHLPERPPGVLQDWVEHVLVNLVIQCPCIVVRRAVYERLGGFDESYAYCADYDMWQRIACEYPIWCEPQALAEYREHAASATHRLFDLPRRWREQQACLRAGMPRLSPVVRTLAEQNGRHHLLRLARHELRAAWSGLGWTDRARGLWALARLGRPNELLAVWRRRHPQPLPGRAPARDADPSRPRRARVFLLTEFFPFDERAVFGAFRRLRHHLDALLQFGEVDAAFFWPFDREISAEEAEMNRRERLSTWPISGRYFMIRAAYGPEAEAPRHPLRALHWALRGAVSFFDTVPTLRTSAPRQAERLRQALLECQPDLIFAHGQGAFASLIRVRLPRPPVVVDFPDLEHVRLARLIDLQPSRAHRLRARLGVWLARRATRIAMEQARTTLVCSAHDREIAKRLVPAARVVVAPNTSRLADPLPPAPGPTALFVGIADYHPNAEAILRLVHDLWPRVLREIPDAHLTIVGEGGKKIVPGEHAGCTVRDFVADLDEVYRAARMVVCPITRGGGTRTKIIEAAMYQRPVVSTRVGAEGLHFIPEEEILIADEPDAFAAACVALLRDPDRCESIARAARTRALRDYAPARVAEGLLAILRRAAAPEPAATAREAFILIGGTSEPGGLHVHTADVARAIAAAGHPVTVLCPSVDYFTPLLGDSPVNVEVIPPRRPDESAVLYWRRYLARYRQATAVLCRGKLAEGPLADLIGIRCATHRLLTIDHRNFDPPWSYAASPRLHGLVHRALVDRAIAVSPEITDTAIQLMGLDPARVATCVNWVDPTIRPSTAAQRAEAKHELGWSADTLVIGYHGRLAPEKRVDALLDAVAAIPIPASRPLRVAILGDGWKRRELEAHAVSRGLSDRVRFLGWQADPGPVLAAFDIAVLPSTAEGFPLGLMESMAAAAACLAHPMSSTRLLIRPNENGVLADLADPAAFARALADLIHLTDEERARLGTAAAATIARDFTRARRLPDVLRALGLRVTEAAADLPARPRRLEFAKA